jgi:hypothetical protein
MLRMEYLSLIATTLLFGDDEIPPPPERRLTTRSTSIVTATGDRVSSTGARPAHTVAQSRTLYIGNRRLACFRQRH